MYRSEGKTGSTKFKYLATKIDNLQRRAAVNRSAFELQILSHYELMAAVKNETKGHLETKQDRCSFVLNMAENTSVGGLEGF